MQKSFLSPLLREPGGRYSIVNERTGSDIATHVTAALDSRSRRKGLLGREGLKEGEALIIAQTNAIHTFFMRFPIDVAFVRRDGRVVTTRNTLKPWRLAASLSAHLVVELPAGVLSRTGTRRDDMLTLLARQPLNALRPE